MLVQITTEAVDIFTPQQQRDVVHAVMPEAVSIAPGEMLPDASEEKNAAELYEFLNKSEIAVQHIIYDIEGIAQFAELARRGIIAGDKHSLLFPLGRYAEGQQSDPASLVPFLSKLAETGLSDQCEWACCAFGIGETASLAAALAMGGKVRVGFENSLWHADGSIAVDNAARVVAVANIARALDLF